MPNKTTARDFFLHLLSTVLLYMGMISLTMVVFVIINHFIPDAAAVDYYWRTTADRLRVPMSMLIVSFPIFIWTVWFIKKLIKKEPEMKDFRVRKWLMYFTIFAAAVIIIITLIIVLNNFFNGEFTIRFLLKILTVLAIATGTLWFYLIEVKENNGRALTQKIISWLVITAVLASVVVGFVIMGSPATQRAIKIDNQRTADLQTIYFTIENYYRELGIPPTDLSELRNLPIKLNTLPSDPVTKTPYIYEYLDETSFKLCAVFDQPSVGLNSMQAGPAYSNENNNWEHPAGYYCFWRDVSYLDDETDKPPVVYEDLPTVPLE